MTQDKAHRSQPFCSQPFMTMFRKIFLFIIIIIIILIIILIAFLGGIFSVSFSPFSININKSEKDFLRRVGTKTKNIIYREATEHNPAGDVLPDRIDDKLKQKIKEKIN